MRLKKAGAALTALVCSAMMLTSMPLQSSVVSADVIENDFEITYDGWCGTDDTVQLTAIEGIGYAGSRGMSVSGRTSSDKGATSDKRFYLAGGIKYQYSVQVKSETAETFRMTLTYQEGEDGEVVTKTLDVKDAAAGEWTKLSANFKAPYNALDMRVSIVTDSTNDFVMDAFEVTTNQKVDPNTAYAAGGGLKDAYANYFRVGSVLNSGTVRNAGITANILKNFNSITFENEMKPDATMSKSNSSGNNIGVSLNSAASILDFCEKNGIGVRGHTLVWHSQTPQWAFKEGFNDGGAWVSSSAMDARMESYIKNLFAAVASQYPSLDLYAYDVANECVSDDSNRTANNGGARVPGYGNGASPWVQIYGSNAFVEKAFTYARKYAPENCKLFYNDYNEYWDHKRDCIYNMCKSLYQKGVLDGVGMQSHINADYNGFSGVQAYTTALKKYASIGCEVQITELDISRENGKFSDQQQSDKYKALFQLAMEVDNVTAVCVWGPNDANTWIGSENAPLLFDGNNQPKTAYNTLMSLVPQSNWGDGDNISGGPTTPEPDENGWFFHSTYEDNTDSWNGRGSASVATSGNAAYQGGKALYVTGREAAWNGATRTLNSRAFVPGEQFSFSANVCYTSGAATDTFYMKLQYVDASGETMYDSIAEGTAIQGEWMQLANTNYTIPAGATDLQLYIETADSTVSFYVDEAIGAVAGTKIDGPGQSGFMLGDLDSDGMITGTDLAMAKRGMMKGFDSNGDKLAADVDQSGVVDAADMTYLAQYLSCQITEFPVAERVVDFAKMDQLFSSINLTSSLKKDNENNALYTQRFGADPGFMVYKDRLYVYMTNDAFEYDGNGNLKENSYDVQEINCISSSDLVNWTDHGAIPVAGGSGAARWAYASWAPDACWKTINGKDKFFLYFANSAGGIGVLTADSPTGPWTDPIGKALVTKQTPNCGDVEWMFDPGVFVDDDGTGYLYFGGGVPSGKAADPGTARVVKLGADMISLDGTPARINPPYLFEDSSILKIGNTYYYSYCTNFNVPGGQAFGSGEICYMTSNNPMGPFTYAGRMFKNPASFGLDGGGNNHHSFVEFKGKYYLLYHARAIERRMNVSLNYRSPHIDVANVSNGSITVTGTMTGVSQLESLNPYEVVQAETMAQQAGINVSGVGNTVVSDISAGDWIKLKGVDFGNGCTKLTVRVSSTSGAAIKVCTGGPSGKAFGYVEIPAGTTMSEITVPVNSVSGVNDLCFVFSGALQFDTWCFS